MTEFSVRNIFYIEPRDLENSLPLVRLVPAWEVLFEIDLFILIKKFPLLSYRRLHLSETNKMATSVDAE